MTDERRPETPAESEGTTGLFTALGKMVKLLRERKGLTQREFGERVGYGPDAISAMERGVRVPRPELLEKADELLNAGGLLTAALPEVREAMSRARTRHPEWYRSYAGLEAEAVSLYDYSTMGVLGLLQTETYARAVFTQRHPPLDEETIERRVTDRLSRQQLFERWPPPECSFVMEQAVLERPIGSDEVHAEQLRRLLRIGRLRNVQLQVMPTKRHEHPCLDNSFTLLTPKGREQVAYLESQGYPRLITDREEVRILAGRYGIIRAQALNPHESLDLIEKTLEEP
ncbi:helix-turn-helix domain-containing protein [Streptomyces luteolifulvus]|uniref:Helix-turn-helix domain-containing protein n=1 Tax=Streptomyces luteolifulvus TaxID=2615112 RepID=A0A6H9UZJ6_9ACTN|nr:helix-turn-helix transcriptional regulator [Streptomyces luteolifulvus]KAB1144199.1 helix-turn-helix domain-containing protein [Streptomyces luteolifulvus]